MVKTASTMLPLGTRAPAFSLPNTDGQMVTLADFSGSRGLLVMFICNHCPFVKHLQKEMAALASECQVKGISVVAISSNDASTYPQDGPEAMRAEAAVAKYSFPYLYDATQDVAQAYKAACTPDFFLFDGTQSLVYRGQFDDSRPSNGKPVTGADLRAACDAMLTNKPMIQNQRPSLGCNIKWLPGKEPEYFTGVSACE